MVVILKYYCKHYLTALAATKKLEETKISLHDDLSKMENTHIFP